MSWAKDNEMKFAFSHAWTQRITESRRLSAEGRRRTSIWRMVADGVLARSLSVGSAEEGSGRSLLTGSAELTNFIALKCQGWIA